MAVQKISITNPQEPDNDVSMILESGSFDTGGGGISSVSSIASTSSTTSIESTGSSSKPYYTFSSKKIYSSTPQKIINYRSSSHHRHHHSQHYLLPVVSTTKRRKPSRIFMYVRNRTLLNYGNYYPKLPRAYNISAMVISFLLVSLTVQRLLSLYFTHRRWINAPITYMHRSCPLPTYELLYPTAPTTLEEQQQLQLSRSLLSVSSTSTRQSAETNSDTTTTDRKSTRLNSSHLDLSRMPSSA